MHPTIPSLVRYPIREFLPADNNFALFWVQIDALWTVLYEKTVGPFFTSGRNLENFDQKSWRNLGRKFGKKVGKALLGKVRNKQTAIHFDHS